MKQFSFCELQKERKLIAGKLSNRNSVRPTCRCGVLQIKLPKWNWEHLSICCGGSWAQLMFDHSAESKCCECYKRLWRRSLATFRHVNSFRSAQLCGPLKAKCHNKRTRTHSHIHKILVLITALGKFPSVLIKHFTQCGPGQKKIKWEVLKIPIKGQTESEREE